MSSRKLQMSRTRSSRFLVDNLASPSKVLLILLLRGLDPGLILRGPEPDSGLKTSSSLIALGIWLVFGCRAEKASA
ncbi:hypothetical protein ARMSODRAFT_60755 [Armillaria solidipes]|uniref:Uncharacterized protein n=1 Tax=Armillaria solidipes TaxID=1076256 RepID=A0A2H3CQ91_9AGAR|nr:hypothetical protein ARMSODRAFT_60755 [Armillaria solidipes]